MTTVQEHDSAGCGIRLLLVEDDPDSGEATRNMLELRNINVTLVSRIDEALRVFSPESFDVVVADVRLEGIGGRTGVDVLRWVRRTLPDFPVILFTGYDTIQSAVEAVRLGAQDYILKPLGVIEDLLVPVEKAVRGYRLLRRSHEVETQLRASHDQLRQLAARLQSVREEERTRIARAIHDELGQSLTVMKMDIAWLMKRLPEGGPALYQKLETMKDLSDEMIGSVQRICSELRPAVLDNLGIVAAIEWLSEQVEEHSGAECKVDLNIPDGALREELSTAIFRIVQEILTNAMRHAHATQVSISMRLDGDMVELQVSDNGSGIDEQSIARTGSLGLVGMRERALALGGRIDIRRGESGGTVVLLRAPLAGGPGETAP